MNTDDDIDERIFTDIYAEHFLLLFHHYDVMYSIILSRLTFESLPCFFVDAWTSIMSRF